MRRKKKRGKFTGASIVSLCVLGILYIMNPGKIDLGFLNPDNSVEVNGTIDQPDEIEKTDSIPEIKIVDDDVYLNDKLVVNISSLPQKISEINKGKKVKLNSTHAKVITFKSVENILNENEIVIIEVKN